VSLRFFSGTVFLQTEGCVSRCLTPLQPCVYNTLPHMSTFCALSLSAVKPNKLREIRNLSGCNIRVNVKAEMKLLRQTSGRLHPLWPQDKRLHTPQSTDYRHSRQDRWIQTELVSALAKIATKPNPFEIVLLQTTRKENNWKTEETLERAVVTLETEQIKGSNPWCLWRWCNWHYFSVALWNF